MELKYFEKEATFVQKIRFTKHQYDIDCYLEYGACNDESCMPPTQVTFRKSGNIELKDAAIELYNFINDIKAEEVPAA